MDDDRIKNFLILNKCSIERTKEKIDNYYTIRAAFSEFFLHPESEEVKSALEIVYVVTLPKLNKDLRRVLIAKVRKSELVDEIQPIFLVARVIQIQEVRLKEDCMFKNLILIDMENVSWRYMSKYTPTFLLKLYRMLEKIYSLRATELYIFNASPILEPLLGILKRILKQKLFQRIHVFQGSTILYEILSKEEIPRDYGGKGKSLEELSVMQASKLAEYHERFNKLEKMKVDESLRPKILQNDDLLGFYGNFKQLNVD